MKIVETRHRRRAFPPEFQNVGLQASQRHNGGTSELAIRSGVLGNNNIFLFGLVDPHTGRSWRHSQISRGVD